ncbi:MULTISPECIES: YlbL family protein [unclassified Nocardioides]|uniref:YlbL family protein n=1 Tax=unclassified Nocardioides TaxID=2615069 RepID=UPI003014E88E
MTQRTVAALVAVPLLLALLLLALLVPLPYATYEPGLTVDVLGKSGDQEIISVEGHPVYRDDGNLRMTTVFVSVAGPQGDKRLPELIQTWLDDDDAVYPYDVVHPDGQTREQDEREGAVDMVTSQDTATAVALTEMGETVEPEIGVSYVEEGAPADGRLEVRDLLLKVDGVRITDSKQITDAVQGADGPVTFDVLRAGAEKKVKVTPTNVDGTRQIGISLGPLYRFPFDVSVNIDPAIGGPSAGLMFSLAIYDTLTPGSLTDGHDIAGTGTISADGSVGPIGGIEQKIAGARGDGAELFLVPPDNCDEAARLDDPGLRLVRADTMHDARLAIEAWAADPDADLPSCEAS